MTRWLVTGAAGMLGHDLVDAARNTPGVELTALDRAGLDITDAEAVHTALAGSARPYDVVVNTAAWTDVDAAETAEAAATLVNGTGVAHLARACAATGAQLVHVSTDYVFAGDASSPYAEDAAPDPVSAYGRAKLAGERALLELLPDRGYVVRTAWLYGERGRNFVRTILGLSAQRETLDVVDDQVGQPTWSAMLAGALVQLGTAAAAGRVAPGIYHASAGGQTSWFCLAREIFTQVGLDPARIRPTSSTAYQRPARRPGYSVLGHDRWIRAGLSPLPHWRAMLKEALAQLRCATPVPGAVPLGATPVPGAVTAGATPVPGAVPLGATPVPGAGPAFTSDLKASQ